MAISSRLESAYCDSYQNREEDLQKAKESLAILKQERFANGSIAKFEIQTMIMDGSYDEAFMLVSTCDLDLDSWKELAHLLIEKLKCPNRSNIFQP